MTTVEMLFFCVAAGLLAIGIIGMITHRNDTKTQPMGIYIIMTATGFFTGMFTGAALMGRESKLTQQEICISTLQALGDNRSDSLYILTLAPCVLVKDSILIKMATEPEAR